jgi:DnaK suppressor protein
MDKKQEKKIREQLIEQRQEIADEMQRHGGVLERGAMSEMKDPEDRAASIADLWVDDRIARNDGNLLEKIDLALKRLDEGTYDICAGCGGNIPVARLLAKPSVSLCVTCQAAKDAG